MAKYFPRQLRHCKEDDKITLGWILANKFEKCMG